MPRNTEKFNSEQFEQDLLDAYFHFRSCLPVKDEDTGLEYKKSFKTTQDIATELDDMGGIRVNYRITEQRTFNADTGYLGTDMANWADDLFRSDEVYLVNFIGGVAKVGKRVTLSDSKSKRDNLRDSVPRFSYTYAQRQHNVLDLQRAGRIFDNTFDNTFN